MQRLASVAATVALIAAGSASAAAAAPLQISAGGFHTCIVKADHTPACWGTNQYGATRIPDGLGMVKQISAGTYSTCAVRADDTPVCWGRNDHGQRTIPAGIGTVKQIDAGDTYACAVKTNGTPVCWGDDAYGQTDVPPGIGTVTQISVSTQTTCAVKADGTPVCWGNEATIPPEVGKVKQIAAGSSFVCAIRIDGTPTCWGAPDFGETTVPPGTGTVTQIDLGYEHACAVKTDGHPVCWGQTSDGATQVPAGTGTVTQVSTGGWHSCAIRTTGGYVCWGRNTNGQLRPSPPRVNLFVPIDGARYVEGARVVAEYSCEDRSGSGIASCTAPVPSGERVDTDKVGFYAFTVTATDRAGARTSQTVHYEVLSRGRIGLRKHAKVIDRDGNLFADTGMQAICPHAGPDCTGTLSWRASDGSGHVDTAAIRVKGAHQKELVFGLGKRRSQALRNGHRLHLRIDVDLSRGTERHTHRVRHVALSLNE